jgi:serine/threonine protein kinase
MGITAQKFVESLSAHSILSGDEVSSLRAQLTPATLAGDAETLAKELIRQGKLTKYQAANIYQGRGKGLVFGEYIVLDKLGAGGMGQVFKAQHRKMKRLVALKVLPPHATTSSRNVKRFYQEVEVAAKLTHPNIVTAFDAGESHGLHFLVMEYVDGQDLSSYVSKHGTLSVEQAINCMLYAAKALEYAHGRGIIHRDIKPSNLLLDRRGTVKILDMGLARTIDNDTPGAVELTETGQVLGTVDYMAPEQAANTRLADARADIYSLGCALFRVLIGRPPYAGETSIEKILAHREQLIPSLRALRPEVPAALDRLFQQMLAKSPVQRIQSMSEVVKALEKLAAGVGAEEASIMLDAEEVDRDLSNFLSAQSTGSSMIERGSKGSTSGTGRRDASTDPGSRVSNPSLPAVETKKFPTWVPWAAAGVGAAAIGIALAVVFSGGGKKAEPTTVAAVAKETPAEPPAVRNPTEIKPVAKPAEPAKIEKPDFTTTPVTAKTLDFSKPINLLELIDPARDKVIGDWKFDREALISGTGPWARLQIPVTPPEEYDMVATVERITGTNGVFLGLVSGGSQSLVIIEGWYGRHSGLQWLDTEQCDKNETRFDGRLIGSEPAEFVCSVRKSGILATCNGKLFLNWQGDKKRLSVGPECKVLRPDQLFVGTYDSMYRISKLELRPPDRKADGILAAATKPEPISAQPSAAPPPPLKLTGPTDLLALIDPKRDGRDGLWQKEGSSLAMAKRGGGRPLILIPATPPEEYDLTVAFHPTEVGEPLGLGLLVGGRSVAALFDNYTVGLDMIGTEGYRSNKSARRMTATVANKPITIICAVRKGRVFATVNDTLAFDWSGDPAELSLWNIYASVDKRMFLSCHGQCRFNKVEIAPPTAKSPQYTPVDLLARANPQRDAASGDWSRDGQDLVLSAVRGNFSHLALPAVRPNEYVLTAVVERQIGGDNFSMGLARRGIRLTAALDSMGRTASGLNRINNQNFDMNPTGHHEPCVLMPDRLHTVTCRVANESIDLECDGRLISAWTPSLGPLTMDDPNRMAPGDEPLAISSWQTGWRISKLELKPLDWKRLPEPPTADRNKAVDQLAEVIGPANAKNASADMKTAAAAALLRNAAETLDRPAERFAMLDESLRLASEAGNVTLAYNAAENLTSVFEVDNRSYEKRVSDALKGTRSASARQEMVNDALRLIERARESGRYDLAIDLQSALAAAAPKTGATELQKELKTLGVELGVWKTEYEAYLAGQQTLAKKPDDAAARTAVGRYLGLVVGDWKRAVDHLEKGADINLQAIARSEFEPPKEADKQAALGDAWWALFEKAGGPLRWLYMERAANWYRRAALEATGKAKSTIDQRRLKILQERKISGLAFALRHPLDAVKIGDRWYKVYSDPSRWHMAAAICEKLGGSLAIPDSPIKNEGVAQLVLAQTKKSESTMYWIGASDEQKEGEFRWVDGSIVGKNGYAPWRSGEPNNANGTEDLGRAVAYFEKGQLKVGWEDTYQQDLPFVCEWDH